VASDVSPCHIRRARAPETTLKRCPTAFACFDPEEDRVHYVPTCAWNLHKDAAMRRIVAHYAAAPGT